MNKLIKEYAASKGLKYAHNVAYGRLHGYAATLSQGDSFVQIILSTRFPNEERQKEFETKARSKDFAKEYKIQDLTFFPENIRIVFTYTGKKVLTNMNAFIQWFFPLLDSSDAGGVHICSECGEEITDGCWKLIHGVAYHMHNGCAQKLYTNVEAANQARKENSGGSYITGCLGALLGATLGGVLWGLILLIGYVASIVGYVIGFLANIGYVLFLGKPKKGKIVILIFATIFGVCFGTLFSDSIQLLKEGVKFKELPEVFSILFRDGDYLFSTVLNMVLGLLFAALGVFSLLKNAGQEVSDVKIIDLE